MKTKGLRTNAMLVGSADTFSSQVAEMTMFISPKPRMKSDLMTVTIPNERNHEG